VHLSRVSISIVVVLVAFLWAVYLIFVENVPLSWAHAAPFSVVVGGLVLVGMWFEHQLWRLPLIDRFVKRPNLRGTWEAELKSSYEKPGTDEPIRCFIAIKQSYSTLQFRLMTPESESWLIAESITASPKGGDYQVVGVYINQPNVHVRNRSEIHRGTLWLDTHGPKERPTALSGEYWTDRGTKGTLSLNRRVTKIHSRFNDAATEFDTLAS
jgi:hypothetical protein